MVKTSLLGLRPKLCVCTNTEGRVRLFACASLSESLLIAHPIDLVFILFV